MSRMTALKIAVEESEPEEVDDREVWPSPGVPLAVARKLLAEQSQGEHLLLRKWRGDYYGYVGPHWRVADPEGLRKWIYDRLENVVYLKVTKKKDGTEIEERVNWAPSKGKIDQIIDALASGAWLSPDIEAPAWLPNGESAAGLVPCRNGLVDVQDHSITPCTPSYFGTTAIPLDYDPDAGEPVEWMKFLRSIWPDVPSPEGPRLAPEIVTLQMWLGYVLSGRLDLQKALLVVGPPRSGKGTIARTITDLIGQANCSAPTLAGMSTNFGLESSIGKALMVVGDARLSQNGQETVVERLLSITGQDNLTLDRKNRTAWTGTMSCRIMILSNELPRFVDDSAAIASRFVILKMNRSFLGQEDVDLGKRISTELPAILRWALQGLSMVNVLGRIHEPDSHIEAMQEMTSMASPIKAFLRDACGVGDPDIDQDELAATPFSMPFAKLYEEYSAWCDENGRMRKNTASFSSALKTAMPHLKTDHRPRTPEGKKLPRHVVGLRLIPDWADRPRRNVWSR